LHVLSPAVPVIDVDSEYLIAEKSRFPVVRRCHIAKAPDGNNHHRFLRVAKSLDQQMHSALVLRELVASGVFRIS
jgi:hypothetical protein